MAKEDAEYWTGRAERNLGALDAMTEEQGQSLTEALEAAQREVEAEIERFYRRYAQNNAISYAEAQKALSLKELRDFQGRLAEFQKLSMQHLGEFSLEVDNLSVKARITRYQALQAEIGSSLQRAYLSMERNMATGAVAVYDDQYHRALFEVDRYTGFHHQYVGIDQAVVKETMRYPFNGMDYSERIWHQRDDLSYKLRASLNTMFVTGEPPDKYAKKFAEAFGAKEREAYRLLYTENAYMAEQAKTRGYRDTGVKEYEIVATLDSHTSEICREQDGKRYKVGEEKPGVNFPPFHPWCRTVTVPVVTGMDEIEGLARAARDPETGKTIRVPASMTYEQWKNGLEGARGLNTEGGREKTHD